MPVPERLAPHADRRPLSPHLQIWRWHVTMASSILNRITGGALYAAAIGLAIWLLALASGPEAFNTVNALAFTLPGQLVIYLALVALAYHLANGFRHIVWDFGYGYEAKTAEGTSWFCIIFALIAPIGVFALANL